MDVKDGERRYIGTCHHFQRLDVVTRPLAVVRRGQAVVEERAVKGSVPGLRVLPCGAPETISVIA